MSVTLSEAIQQIREELGKAILAGMDQSIVFTPTNIELELGITFAIEAKAGSGYKLLTFLDISGEGKVYRESQNKIKLSLSVSDKEGNPLKVRAESLPGGL